jgi:hypothetical protein
MRRIIIEQLQQPDGTIHHQATVGCALEPCSKIYPEGIFPESCDYLHSNGVDGEGNLLWCCNKPPCSSGV